MNINFYDGETAEGIAYFGVLEGKVRQFSLDGQLNCVGIYENGRPHGPAWLISSFLDDEGAVLVHYSNGKIDQNVGVIHLGAKIARIGMLVNQTYLEKSQKFDIKKIGEVDCIKVNVKFGRWYFQDWDYFFFNFRLSI